MSSVGKRVRLLSPVLDVPVGAEGVIVEQYPADDSLFWVLFDGIVERVVFWGGEFDPRDATYKIEVLP